MVTIWMFSNTYRHIKGCKRKNVAIAVLSSGESYTAARRLKAFMLMHMGLVKTIKLTNIILFIIKYSQGPGLHRHPKVPDCQGLDSYDSEFRLSPVLNNL